MTVGHEQDHVAFPFLIGMFGNFAFGDDVCTVGLNPVSFPSSVCSFVPTVGPFHIHILSVAAGNRMKTAVSGLALLFDIVIIMLVSPSCEFI